MGHHYFLILLMSTIAHCFGIRLQPEFIGDKGIYILVTISLAIQIYAEIL